MTGLCIEIHHDRHQRRWERGQRCLWNDVGVRRHAGAHDAPGGCSIEAAHGGGEEKGGEEGGRHGGDG